MDKEKEINFNSPICEIIGHVIELKVAYSDRTEYHCARKDCNYEVTEYEDAGTGA